MNEILAVTPGTIVKINDADDSTMYNQRALYGTVLSSPDNNGLVMIRVAMKEISIQQDVLTPVYREDLSEDTLEETILPVGAVVYISPKMDVDVLDDAVDAVVVGVNDFGDYFVEVDLGNHEKLWFTLKPYEFSLYK